MTAYQGPSARTAMPEWDKCADKTLYWTLSLHIDRSRLPERFHAQFKPSNKLNVQSRYCESAALRDAMEPLFNDIADRERLSEVGDYLLDVPGARQGQWIEITIPDVVQWTTEGTNFAAELGPQAPRLLRARQFWYVHMNGSLSYHVSFCLRYEHTPADFYFIALLQKILAPKEFSAQRAQAGKGASGEPISVLDSETGVFPLDKVLVRRLGEAAAPDPLVPFWHYVRRGFDAHAKDLFDAFGIKVADARGRMTSDYFRTLVATDPFIEVPKLQMPRGRFLFLFDDKRLFRDLLPLPGEDGRRRSRRDFVKDAHYEPFKDWITREADRAKAEGGKAVALTEVALRDIHENAHDELRYLFLSGFIQNIVDFLNQDASEVVDGTDPVYPATAEQEEESFFVRYTNQRSITQFVPGSRSLKTGKDFIGTCPYVFLVHLLAMHNEFLVRDYERQTEALTNDIERFNEEARLSRAADRFYAFRTNDYTRHQKYKYANVFRYDTERDLFEAVEARRGTHRKEQYLDAIVSNLEAQTRDLEGRLRAKVDRQFSLLLAAVGIFSVLQVLYQVLDISTRGLETVSSKPVDMIDFTDVGTAQMMAKYLFLSTSGFLLLTAVLTLWVLRKVILRR